MAKSTIALFLCGIAVAAGLATWQYFLAPQGTLLYTPAAGFKPSYTPSSFVGFFVTALCLSAVSASVAVVSLAAGAFFDRRLIGVSKQAAFLSGRFGFLCALTAATEQFWP
ncbi:hypothetical protein D3C78_1606320 [compost metagenome]